jgi:hypothetical protein
MGFIGMAGKSFHALKQDLERGAEPKEVLSKLLENLESFARTVEEEIEREVGELEQRLRK